MFFEIESNVALADLVQFRLLPYRRKMLGIFHQRVLLFLVMLVLLLPPQN